MDKDFLIAQGDTAKFKLTITHADFDQQTDDFKVVLSIGLMGEQVVVEKADMPHDEDGDFYVIFKTDGMVGFIKAETKYYVPDTDIEGGLREEVDYQYLGFATANPCPKFFRNCVCETLTDDHVKWERVWRSDVGTLYLNLRTKDKEPIVTSDGKQVRVRKEDKDIY